MTPETTTPQTEHGQAKSRAGATASRAVTARVQVAPGVWENVTFPAAASVRWGLVRLRMNAGGQIVPDFKTWTGWYRLTEKPQRDLGLPMHWQWYVVMGLLGKFFKVKRASGRVTLVDVDSLYKFLAACEDEDFWTPERIERQEAARRSYNGRDFRRLNEKPRARRAVPVEPEAAPDVVKVKRAARRTDNHPDLFEV